jgi:4-hydroxy-tetrahydrodipicolinate synthase
MVDAALDGDYVTARRVHEALLPAHRAQGRTGGGAGLVFAKNALRQAGLDVGDPRLPQIPATREQAAQIADDLAGIPSLSALGIRTSRTAFA